MSITNPLLTSRDISALSKAERYKAYLKNKYAKLKEEGIEQDQRRKTLEDEMNNMDLSEEEKIRYRDELEKAEAEARRDMRKRITIDDFESLTIIGRGAFGEVRLVRMKDSNSKEIYGMLIVGLSCHWSIFHSDEVHVKRKHDRKESGWPYSRRKRHSDRI